jgi:hypothetical protein
MTSNETLHSDPLVFVYVLRYLANSNSCLCMFCGILRIAIRVASRTEDCILASVIVPE